MKLKISRRKLLVGSSPTISTNFIMELFTEEEYSKAKFRDLLPCSCDYCNNSFYKNKNYFYNHRKFGFTRHFCSKACQGFLENKKVICKCAYCGSEILKRYKDYKVSKSGNNFCSSSCAASYNNRHKDYGYRRSKFEIYTEQVLLNKFPDIDFSFNDISSISLELDIYIPSLKLAFEINGIFHYEPVYGEEKFHRTQENDLRKKEICKSLGIDLIEVDISSINHFSIELANPFVEQIIEQISIRR